MKTFVGMVAMLVLGIVFLMFSLDTASMAGIYCVTDDTGVTHCVDYKTGKKWTIMTED